jgi:uncharacterized protein YdhG (YjbR/CyaY superfamily)
MAEFSGKIVSAQYIDPEYSIIKVLYDDNGRLTVYNLDVNPDHPDFQALEAEGWTSDKIIDETAEVKKAQSMAFNIEIESAAKKLLEEKFGENINNPDSNAETRISWEDFPTLNEDKDEIFRFKIWAFESEAMKGASPEVKKSLRKATTLAKAIAIYDTLL